MHALINTVMHAGFNILGFWVFVRCLIRMFTHTTMMKLTLNCLGMTRGEIGCCRRIFMAMEVCKLGGKRSSIFGLTQLKIPMTIPSFGTLITSCKLIKTSPITNKLNIQGLNQPNLDKNQYI